MAIAAPLSPDTSAGEVLLPTEPWEWNALRDGDLKAGRIAIVMVENYDPTNPAHTDGDTPVVVDRTEAMRYGVVRAAMALVESVMGTFSASASFCFTEAEYWAYRQTQTTNHQLGVQRRLKLPADPDRRN